MQIRIDRKEYVVSGPEMQGMELRQAADIPGDRDIFEIVPGHSDRKVEDEHVIRVGNGSRFFTAPRTINPGA